MKRVTIMKKPWVFLRKILAGHKKIEPKWHQAKYAPWDGLKAGDIIYFKDIGSPVTIKTEVEKVIQYSDLSPRKVQEILAQYGQSNGLGIDDVPKYFKTVKRKKCCVLFFLKNAQKIESFEIE